jgi:hypothetical protein
LKKVILVFVGVLLSLTIIEAQSVGIRAGLNYSKLLGPLEDGEAYDFADGFHFGFNYGYKFTNKFMLRAELLYTQIGTKRSYSGPGYYKIYSSDTDPTFFDDGIVDMTLTVSNAYINVPLTAAYQLHPKVEVFGGVSLNFLVNPIARGNVRYESKDTPEDITFRQSLDYKYYQDEALEARFASTNILVRLNGELVTIPRFAGAYYQFSEIQKVGSTYNWFDAALTGGINYFFNKGFYAGITVNYGLLDTTNDDMDVSLRSLDETDKFIYRKDKDVNLAGMVSLGFRF